VTDELTDKDRERLKRRSVLFDPDAGAAPGDSPPHPRDVHDTYRALQAIDDRIIGQTTVVASDIRQETGLDGTPAGKALRELCRAGYLETLPFGGTNHQRYVVVDGTM